MTTLKDQREATSRKISELGAQALDRVMRTVRAAVLALVLRLSPVAAARPRVSKWGTYYPAAYTNWKKAADKFVCEYEGPLIEGPIALYIETICEVPKTSKLLIPRGDVDNYAKAAMDAMTASNKIWKDDNQVVLLIASKRFAEEDEEPCTKLGWIEL